MLFRMSDRLKGVLAVLAAGLFFVQAQAWEDEWAQFTSLEEEVLTKIIEVNRGNCERNEFTSLQQEGFSNYVREMVGSIDLGDVKQKWRLEEALKADSRLAIDTTLAFIGNEGAVNAKTERLFHQWKRATKRLADMVIQLHPSVDEGRFRMLLEVRSGELYYFAKALAAYEAKQTEKNYGAVEFHSNLAFEYGQQLDQLMEVMSNQKEGDGMGYAESCNPELPLNE